MGEGCGTLGHHFANSLTVSQESRNTVTDPYAAAAAQTNGSAGPAAKQRALDPNADPFASPDSIGGSSGPRGPKWDEILDRLVVLEPVELMKDQPVPNQPDQKQDFYSANLTVLDGGTISVFTPERELNGKTFPEETNTFEPPYTWESWYAYGRAVTIKLAGLEKSGFPLLLGVVKRCPTGPGYRKGLTWVDATKEWNAYMDQIRAGRSPSKPQFSWGIIDPTAEQRAAALTWYRAQATASA